MSTTRTQGDESDQRLTAMHNETKILEIAEEYTLRHRRGESPSIDDSLTNFPKIDEDLRAVLIGIEVLENLRSTKGSWGGDTEASLANATNMGSVAATTEPPAEFGRYEIKRSLGQGAMGAVYLAWDNTLRRQVAIKIPHNQTSDESLSRFLREARAMATVDHANICSVYDMGDIDGTSFIALEYIEGEPLASVLTTDRTFKGSEAAQLIKQVALGLQAAHDAGIVHRDLKPANIMISPDGTPVVLDFGLARLEASEDAGLTVSGSLIGSPAYMAPEQFLGDQSQIKPTTDVYALGVILYELLCGRRPFDGTPYQVMKQIENDQPIHPTKIDNRIDTVLAEICLHAMSKNACDRFSSAAEMVEALDAYANGETPKRTGRKLPRGWTRIWPLFALLVVPMATFGIIQSLAGTSKRPLSFVPTGDVAGGEVRAVSLGDLDADGDLDAFLSRYQGRLMVQFNDGNGMFVDGPAVPDPDKWRNWEITLGDVDNDGDLDALASKNGWDRIWQNDGNGKFTSIQLDIGDGETNQGVMGDLNGDHYLDLFIPQRGGCQVLINDGGGKFINTQQAFEDAFYCGCALGDLDNDGDLDAFVGTVGSASSQVWINQGDGIFQRSSQNIGQLSTWDVKLVDWDGDGDLDVLTSNEDGPVQIWKNRGNADFELAFTAPEVYDTRGINIADFDDDGDLDIFVSNDVSYDVIWLSEGQRPFSAKHVVGNMRGGRCEIGDLDGDGDIDIFGARAWINQIRQPME